MSSAGIENIWLIYGTFFNYFYPDVKRFIQWLEGVNYKIDRNDFFTQLYFKKKMLLIYRYISFFKLCMSACWRGQRFQSSYEDDISTIDYSLRKGSKICNTGRSWAWTIWGIIFTNETHLVIFSESILVSM